MSTQITADEFLPVTMKHLKEAIKAHNSKRENPSFNEHYNVQQKIGTHMARALCTAADYYKYGAMGKGKLTLDDLVIFAQSIPPDGSGVTGKYMKDSHTSAIIKELRKMPHPKSGISYGTTSTAKIVAKLVKAGYEDLAEELVTATPASLQAKHFGLTQPELEVL